MKYIKLTGQGPVFYRDCIRVAIEAGIELDEETLRSSLRQAIALRDDGEKAIPGSPSGFTLDDAISNMQRLLKETPDDVMEWLDARRPARSQQFYELMQSYRHTPIADQGKVVEAYNAVVDFIESTMKVREV